jgi:hypothetical protein
MTRRDRLWMERAKRRYGRLIDVGARWSVHGSGFAQRRAGDALVLVGAGLLRWDRKLFVALGR